MNTSKSLVGVMLITGSLLAIDGDSQSEPERISVGDRAMTHVEKVRVQERRARLFTMAEKGEDLSEEDVELSEAEQEESSGKNVKIAKSEDQQEQDDKTSVNASKFIKKGVNAATYYTTHEGAFHRPLAVSFLGDSVELEDGSIWAVCSSDRYQTLDWMTGDVIIIIPNHDWFSVYDYRLVNLNTGANVKVNLSLGPIYNGIFTHWIIAIDYYHREICLEDGSVWKLSSLDSTIFNKWLPNDTIIIGINEGWFAGSNPNIMINVNMNNFSMGQCIY